MPLGVHGVCAAARCNDRRLRQIDTLRLKVIDGLLRSRLTYSVRECYARVGDWKIVKSLGLEVVVIQILY